MRKFKLFLALNLLVTAIIAQDTINSYQLFIRAEYHLFNKEYYDALKIYLDLLKSDPNNRNLNFHVGLCCLNTGNYEKALQHFQLYDKHININDLQDSTKFGSSGIFLYLGKTYKLNNRGNQNDVNSEGYKLNPYKSSDVIMSGSDSILIVTSKEGSEKNVYFSRKLKNVWKKPENITGQLGMNNDYFISSLSYDGKRLYATKYDNFEADIFVSRYNGKSWSGFEKVEGINARNWESHACETPDGQVLYFASNRPGGFGGMDIYYSQKDEKGRWGKPINAGSIINTKLSEENPYVTNEGRTLFFSSQGHGGQGGYDIFYSNRTFSDQFTKPENVGYPVSTDDDDMSYHPLTRESQAFYALIADNHNSSGNYGKKDKLQIIGYIDFKDSSQNYSSVKAYVIDNSDNDTIQTLTPDPLTRSFSCKLGEGHYVIMYKADGYKTVYDYVLIPFVLANDAMSIHTSLTPLTNAKGGIVHQMTDTFSNKSSVKAKKEVQSTDENLSHGDGKLYTIQLKTFKTEAETERFSNLPDACVVLSGGVYRVTMGKYYTLVQARKKLIEIKAKGYKDAIVIDFDSSANCIKK